jgi:hypothetical protein
MRGFYRRESGCGVEEEMSWGAFVFKPTTCLENGRYDKRQEKWVLAAPTGVVHWIPAVRSTSLLAEIGGRIVGVGGDLNRQIRAKFHIYFFKLVLVIGDSEVYFFVRMSCVSHKSLSFDRTANSSRAHDIKWVALTAVLIPLSAFCHDSEAVWSCIFSHSHRL